jgi:hypothetical protein
LWLRDGFQAVDAILDADGRLYGRGSADDGYAVFTALATLKALKDHGQPHGRIVILIECSEESGSRDLPYYIDAYAARLGTPSLVICLDSGYGNYEQLWSTTSLRANAINLAHRGCPGGASGLASNIVPNPFMSWQAAGPARIGRLGAIRLPELPCPFGGAHRCRRQVCWAGHCG